MKNKKLITAIATVAMVGSCAAPVWAEGPILIAPNPMAQSQAEAAVIEEAVADESVIMQEMNWMLTMGAVKEVVVYEEENINALLVEGNGQEYEFYLADTTWLVDGAGNPTDPAALVGKNVVVAHEVAMTMSLPPKSAAVAVMEYADVLPNYAVIEAITVQEDGALLVTTDNGDRLVTIVADAQVTPFRTRNMITLEDLRVGDSVVLYYDVLAPSIPAQASTAKVVQLSTTLTESDEAAGVVTPQESEMVCFRDAAEAMGLTLAWDAESRTVIANKAAFSVTITIGSEEYGIHRMRVQAAQPAELRDGRTYVSSDVIAAIQEALQG